MEDMVYIERFIKLLKYQKENPKRPLEYQLGHILKTLEDYNSVYEMKKTEQRLDRLQRRIETMERTMFHTMSNSYDGVGDEELVEKVYSIKTKDELVKMIKEHGLENVETVILLESPRKHDNVEKMKRIQEVTEIFDQYIEEQKREEDLLIIKEYEKKTGRLCGREYKDDLSNVYPDHDSEF